VSLTSKKKQLNFDKIFISTMFRSVFSLDTVVCFSHLSTPKT